MNQEDVINTLVEVKLDDPSKFLIIKETLSRIGIASKDGKTLYQSCHIFHKKGRYYIVSFKELFLVDGKQSTFSEEDRGRRNTIANLLEDWGLLTIVDPAKTEEEAPMRGIKIVPAKDKAQWQFVVKYNIGSDNFHKINLT